ncbi:MAG: response regulator [Planctomycetes bacterium]|nr:response regulator [Planctomycetota bacterium]
MRILCVDDDPSMRAVLCLAFERAGDDQVRACASGEEALIEARRSPPDVLLIDFSLGGMDGVSTVRALRESPETARVNVIFLTANRDRFAVDAMRAAGAVDIIAKPFQPGAIAGRVKRALESAGCASREAEDPLAGLRRKYAAALPGRIALVSRLWRTARNAAAWDDAVVDELTREVHRLSGSGATWGFPDVTAHAQHAERLLGSAARSRAFSDAERRALDERLALLAAAQAAPRERGVSVESKLTLAGGADIERESAARREAPHPTHGAPPVLLLAADAEGARSLADQLEHFGHGAMIVPSLEHVREHAGIERAVLLVDHAFPWQPADVRRVLGGENGGPDADRYPVLFAGPADDFAVRLAAARSGSAAYLTKPLNAHAVAEAIDVVFPQFSPSPYRVLIVDDDEALAAFHTRLLTQAGMSVSAVVDPARALDAVAEAAPEVILLDLVMPGCDGLEVAAVIRQHAAYIGTSIVFLTTESAAETRLAALREGGDDFITKPVDPSALVSMVASRAKRARSLQDSVSRDGLTGLLKHTAIKEHLAAEVSRGRRDGAPLSYALIDVDHFKSVNDRFGHPAGDRVLRCLARLLRQRLRATDVAGRYGGEEFAVILPGTPLQAAADLIDALRDRFSRLAHRADGAEFQTTFSAGLASFPVRNDAETLNAAADASLYRAKRGGRNRVEIDGG